MSSFDYLSSEQTIFSNPDSLDPDFVPKLLPHRENEQKYIATAIQPLFFERSGKQLLVTGASGIGKTAAVKRVLADLAESEEGENIGIAYINCWKANTTYKVIVEISHQLGFKFTLNLKTNEVIDKLKEVAKKRKGVVIILDEIDKAEDHDFIYHLLENIKRKTIILITNEPGWGVNLDSRIRSRLSPEFLEFKRYSPAETGNILRERKKYAFFQDTWEEKAFQKIASKASDYRDIRVGLMLMKVAGEIAEQESSLKVKPEHAEQAISRTDKFKIKSSDELTDEEKSILAICKEHNGKSSGELYKSYQSSGGDKSEKTFKRKLEKLQSRKLIELQPTGEGFHGQSNLIKTKP